MRTLIISLFLVATLLNPLKTNALGGVGDIVFDPTALVQTLTTATTIVKQFEDTLLYRIAINAINIFIGNLINRFSEDTIRWINSGFQGGGPAYVVNPQAYFKNVANREMELQLASIQGTNNIFGNAVIGSAIQTIRTGRLPTGKQLEYTLSSTVQRSLCTEENITRMATQSVDEGLAIGPVGASRNVQIAQRKQLLYSQLCVQNAATNVGLQRTLSSCFAADFNCGGWSAWLDLGTNPNNTEYGQTVRAGQLIAQGVAAKDSLARGEIINGLLSKKKCVKYLQNDAEGNPYPEGTAPCIEERVETPAAAVANMLQSAVQIGPNRAAASQATGVEGILTSLLVATLNRVTSSAFSKSAPSGGGLNSSAVLPFNVNQYGRIGNGVNEFVSGTAGTSTVTGDLVPTISGNSTLLSTIQKNLQENASSKTVIDSKIALFNSYNEDLNALSACYTNVLAQKPELASHPDVSSRAQFINTSRSTNLAGLPKAQKELTDITQVMSKLSALINTLSADQSAETVASVYAQYTSLQTSGTLFDAIKKIELDDEYKNLLNQINTDKTQSLNPRLERCQQLLAPPEINGA